MNYGFLDKKEYKDIPVYQIDLKPRNLPLYIVKMNKCAKKIHRHDYIQIVYISKGKLTHVLNRNKFEIHTGDIFVIPPYIPHYFIDNLNSEFELIEFEFLPEIINEKFSLKNQSDSFFDFAYLEPFLVSEKDIKPRLNLSGHIRLKVEDIFNEILREYKTKSHDFEIAIKALLLRLLVLIGREYKEIKKDKESEQIFNGHKNALLSAIYYIDMNYTNNISVEEAARIAMLSISYFRYLFKIMTNKTFNEYIIDLRIAKAVDLLQTTSNLKVLDICYEVGFNNINHFNRMFRKKTGKTPTSIRKRKL